METLKRVLAILGIVVGAVMIGGWFLVILFFAYGIDDDGVLEVVLSDPVLFVFLLPGIIVFAVSIDGLYRQYKKEKEE